MPSAASPFQIAPAFAIPFVVARHPEPTALNAELRRLFLAKESEGMKFANQKATMKLNKELYESRFDLFKWPDPCVRALREFCWSTLYRAVGELNGYDAGALQKLKGFADAWFHITRRGGYFGLHNHAMASWSGVYCVDPGGNSTDQRESGMLSFPLPNPGASMFMDMALYRMKPPFSLSAQEYRLERGQLILFPSWLVHQVLPFQGEGERVTVAFNAWFKYEGDAL